ncbi:TetR family transcriptional regulator [Streptomyces sp. NBC_00102]|uniref:TetR family transcriptional regulator n=1 Tax=Streptomyces sp. NBC_00102 TaxID=2975652 RepID=UPI00224FBE9C|nr:TetR family transcriptional regulator [Streptomyces sp. NBC_00102]MCX5399906.1 TetR family transcriptional regulator [Streptomyces sp. NBC_00102]
MSHTPGAREAQKLRTRQALLDAALHLLEHQSLSGLGLREVTRAAGVTPTAFYRHFEDVAALGVALVEQTLGSLHGMIGAVLAETGDSEERMDRSIAVTVGHVTARPGHFRFIAREQHGGVARVRAAIASQLTLFTQEVADALAGEPESAGWSREDLLMLGGLHVDHMVTTASTLLDAAPGTEEEVVRVARRRLRLITLGRRHWLDGEGRTPPGGPGASGP